MENELRRLPSVDKVLSDPQIKALEKDYPHELLLKLAREQLEGERESILAGKKSTPPDKIAGAVLERLHALDKPSLHPLINATGVILHTNLGRAPMSEETIAAMDTVSRGYSNLEFNLESGARGSRHVHIEALLRQLTGAEAGMVVNNNAASVLLGLIALARRKEVIVSRGQAVEIGGGFRIPDVMRQSGAKLVEVGTTNCTYIADYEQAITERTAALLRVHSSNFKVVGHTADVTIEEMAELGKRKNIPVFDDLGSGCFLDTTRFGLGPEPMVQRSVAAGCGLIFFSGDKLVGGPQAGIIAGKKEFVDKLKKHPLARAVRIDKTRLAGLTATLTHYLKGEAETKVPVWRMIAMPVEEIERRAQIWAKSMGKNASVIPGESMVGGGSLPGGTLPTRLLAISGAGKKANYAQLLAEKLRSRPVPVIGRISENTLLLDPRSVLPPEDEIVRKALEEVGTGI